MRFDPRFRAEPIAHAELGRAAADVDEPGAQPRAACGPGDSWRDGRANLSREVPLAGVGARAQLRRVDLERLEHLAAIQRRPNVRLGVVPWSADANVVALHGFHIYDERVVTVSVFTGNATITDPLDVREYLALFSRLERLAVGQVDAIFVYRILKGLHVVGTDLMPQPARAASDERDSAAEVE